MPPSWPTLRADPEHFLRAGRIVLVRSRPSRQHLLARSRIAERANAWLEAAWTRGWCADPALDADALWAKAYVGFTRADEDGGRSGEDVEDFRLRLARLSDSITLEASLNPLGRTIAHGQLVRVIRQRLALGRLWRRQPDLAETPIAPPVIVVGQMRSGTTRLHRLLAADPALSATRFCDSWMPVPRAIDLRRVQGGLALLLARTLNPWLDTLHPFGAARADEELGWLAAALSPCAYEAQWRIPSYSRWSESRSAAPVYREFARILATDAARHGTASRPRVIKVPQFAEDLSELLAIYPGARVVVSRRDPAAVATSAVSLCANQMAMQSDAISLAELEEECWRKIDLRDARVAAALDAFQGAVAYADYDALQADWRTAIAAIYRDLDLPLTAGAEAAMARESMAAARQPHVQHRADLRRMTDGAIAHAEPAVS